MTYGVTITKTFCAAHRLEGHPKCGRLHGHNYSVEAIVVSDRLDDAERMLVDFGVVKNALGGIIKELDHRYLVSTENMIAQDPYEKVAMQTGDAVHLPIVATTAECLAAYIHSEMISLLRLKPPMEVVIRVRETEGNVAFYAPGEDYGHS